MTKTATKAKTARNAKAAPKAKTAKPAKQDIITSVTISKEGDYIVVVNDTRSEMFTRHKRGDSKEFRAIAVKGSSFDAAQRWHEKNPVPKPQAQLARGIDAKDAPQSAKAVSDQAKGPKAKALGATGGGVSKGKNGKDRAVKADKAKQPSKGSNRAYKLAGRKDESKPGTFRTYMLSTIMAHKDTDSAKAAHAKSKQYPTHKLDFNWAAQQGYIAFTNK